MRGSKTEYSSLSQDSKGRNQTAYSQEIEAMMYTCGDVRSPEKDSTAYMEQIIYVQMKILLNKAYEISRIKGSKKISVEDIVFLMRNNPCRVKKLSNYITFKDVRNKMSKDVISLKSTNRTKLKYNWLPRNVYESYEEVDGRLYEIDRMTEGMTKEEYLDFTECRQASFTFRKGKKFKEFLNTEYKIKDDLLDILGFLACEIVFEIISMACKISSMKYKKLDVTPDVKGMFKAKASKRPITIPDIDEACRKLKAIHLVY